MDKKKSRSRMRKVRHRSLRRRVSGSPERPRLAVFRSARHIYAQIIDDSSGVTIVSASTLDTDLRKSMSGAKTSRSQAVGQALAKRALEQNVTKVLLDRGGHNYHGRVAALANAAREAGLEF
jgi:large subunit ribosomal protein L18